MKRLIGILTALSFPWLLIAQGPISFGPKIGWNMNHLSTDYTDYVAELKNGFQGGLFISIYMDKMYLQPEAYFSIKRGAIDMTIDDPFGSNTSMEMKQNFNLATIDLPIILGFKLLDLKLARLRVWGGPVASFILNKNYILSLDGFDESDRISKDDFKDATWAVQFGAGLDLLFLTFDVGYEFGLAHFAELSSFDDLDYRNNLFFCSIGWRIF